MISLDELKKNLNIVTQNIQKLTAEKIKIVAVTKKFPVELWSSCYEVGITSLGENRVQELQTKSEVGSHLPLEVHFIGALQKNKVKHLVGLIHSYDALSSESVLNMLEKKWQENNLAGLEVLLQINSTNEEQKSGLPIKEETQIIEFAARCLESGYINLQGLMTMGPTPNQSYFPSMSNYDKDAKTAFEKTAILREKLELKLKLPLPRLSMGMSHDYQLAIPQGSNEIRLGTALFGRRD